MGARSSCCYVRDQVMTETESRAGTSLNIIQPKPIDENTFLVRVQGDEKYKPLLETDVPQKLSPPFPVPKPDDPKEVKDAYESKKNRYQENINTEFRKFIDDEPSDVYLVFQPMWNAKSLKLGGLEVLCRVKNGKDEAPMPGMAVWQAAHKTEAIRFLIKQINFAVCACQQLSVKVRVSVNVRPDELLAEIPVAQAKDLPASIQPGIHKVKDFLIAKSKEAKNLLIEITEYSPITENTITVLRELKTAGVLLALDDVTEVRDDPVPKAMAKTGQHSCSFKLGKDLADIFAVQKLAMPMSCSVYRVEVFPTPSWDDGKAHPFLKGMIFPEDQEEDIILRKKLVEDWYQQVSDLNPETLFVIECSVYPADITKWSPEIPIHSSDMFLMQGGKSGGRGFPLAAFTGTG